MSYFDKSKAYHIYGKGKCLNHIDHRLKLTDDDMTRIRSIAQVVFERYVISDFDGSWSDDEKEIYHIMEELMQSAWGFGDLFRRNMTIMDCYRQGDYYC